MPQPLSHRVVIIEVLDLIFWERQINTTNYLRQIERWLMYQSRFEAGTSRSQIYSVNVMSKLWCVSSCVYITLYIDHSTLFTLNSTSVPKDYSSSVRNVSNTSLFQRQSNNAVLIEVLQLAASLPVTSFGAGKEKGASLNQTKLIISKRAVFFIKPKPSICGYWRAERIMMGMKNC